MDHALNINVPGNFSFTWEICMHDKLNAGVVVYINLKYFNSFKD